MASLLDRFGLRRRKDTRVAVRWVVDVQIRGSDSFIGFETVDLSCSGLCLQARSKDTLERVRRPKGATPMRLRLPAPHGPIDFEAEMTWERDEDGKALSGWSFRHIGREARSVIEEHIQAHPEAIVQQSGPTAPGDVPRGGGQ